MMSDLWSTPDSNIWLRNHPMYLSKIMETGPSHFVDSGFRSHFWLYLERYKHVACTFYGILQLINGYPAWYSLFSRLSNGQMDCRYPGTGDLIPLIKPRFGWSFNESGGHIRLS